MQFSVIVPVYNRPDEVYELLVSLSKQTYPPYEILVIEDGSTNRCKKIAEGFKKQLNIRYYYKENSGQGFSRNYGFEKAEGDYLVVFDSDCIIPEHYFQTVKTFIEKKGGIDCWGGPDRSHPSFSMIQKAISYSMTSPLTTGGIRGNKKHVGQFHPRSFNMGISKKVYEETGGYIITRMGEDIEFSIRILKHGFKTHLIEEAYVYHKRRTNFLQFYKQLRFFGRARINIARFHPEEIKWIHVLPSFFLIVFLLSIASYFFSSGISTKTINMFGLYAVLLYLHAIYKLKNPFTALFGVIAGFTQLTAYGEGFICETFNYIRESK